MYNDYDDFQRREEEGRKAAYEVISKLGKIKGWEPTKGKYAPVDVFFTGTTKEYVLEIKRLHSNSTDYPDRYLEKNKYDALMEYDHRTRLFMVIFDDSVYIWDIGKTEPYWEVKHLNATTAGGTYGQNYRDKTVTRLRYNDAVYHKKDWTIS